MPHLSRVSLAKRRLPGRVFGGCSLRNAPEGYSISSSAIQRLNLRMSAARATPMGVALTMRCNQAPSAGLIICGFAFSALPMSSSMRLSSSRWRFARLFKAVVPCRVSRTRTKRRSRPPWSLRTSPFRPALCTSPTTALWCSCKNSANSLMVAHPRPVYPAIPRSKRYC